MHEVIIERPRYAHWRRYPRQRTRNATRCRDDRGGIDDTSPLREPMGGFYREKSLSDNLAPLRRFLRARVGQPWSKVWSEISAQLSVTSAIKKHVMDHLREYVVERVREDDEGRFWGPDRFGRPSPPSRFFVHPRTGLLAEAPRYPRKRASRARIRRPDVRVLSPTRQLRRLRGIWYEVVIAELPFKTGPGSVAFVRDAIAKIDPRDARGQYENESVRDLWYERRYAQSLRQLSKRELRRYFEVASPR